MSNVKMSKRLIVKFIKLKNVTDRKSAEANSPIAANVGVWNLGSRMILHIVARFPTTPKNAIVKVAQANTFSKVVSIYRSRKVVSSKVESSPIPSSILEFTSSSIFFEADVVILSTFLFLMGNLITFTKLVSTNTN